MRRFFLIAGAPLLPGIVLAQDRESLGDDGHHRRVGHPHLQGARKRKPIMVTAPMNMQIAMNLLLRSLIAQRRPAAGNGEPHRQRER
jgi:hypothetical protein